MHPCAKKGGLNVVGEVLKSQGKFIKLNHYPKGDVFDRDSHAQYYYHAHRSGEHGHFHTFLRQPGMPKGVEPVPEAASRDWPKGDQALAHLLAISMDRYGTPIGLFPTNRWVTGETWYLADDACAALLRSSQTSRHGDLRSAPPAPAGTIEADDAMNVPPRGKVPPADERPALLKPGQVQVDGRRSSG